MSAPSLVEDFFRHEYGRLVARLSHRVGVQHIEGRQTGRRRILERNAQEGPSGSESAPEIVLASEVQDDLLRMLFACCHETIPVDAQLVLALKTLCGFSTREIALRLFASEANVYKRLARARSRLRKLSLWPGELAAEQYRSRLPSVHRILYLLFTEGYLSAHAETAIRRELCQEAMRLGVILVEHPVGQAPETHALLALMHLHAARMPSRQDASGGLLLLEEQDRNLWDRRAIEIGLQYLAKSAQGDHFSRYHAEAGIAAEHCLAPSFLETRWDRVVQCYSLLEQVAPSPIHRLNRAVAVAEWKGPAAGLAALEGFEPPAWLAGSYMWAAVLSDLHRRCGDGAAAERYRDAALKSAPTPAVKELLRRRLQTGGSG